MKNPRLAALAIVLGLAAAAPARAAVVLIDSYDNVLAPDGTYALLYPNHYQAREFRDADGGKHPADVNLDLLFVRAIAYKHVNKIPLAFQVIVPVGNLDANLPVADLTNKNSSGVGDTIFGPGVFLYQNEKSGTYVSYWLYAFAPTGAYDTDNGPLNLGTNHWYFEHQLALNQVLYKKVVVDTNLNFYHHTEDRDANTRAPLRFEVAAIAGYQLTAKLLAGVHGGAYWDLGNAKADGEPAPDTKARKAAVGPALSYQWTPKLATTIRWTRDVMARNDFVGNDFWLRASYAF